MTLTEFLSKLARVKPQAGDMGYLASCPAHGSGGGDKNPSLSVRSVDGKILLNCFAGCTADAVLSSLGLDAKALFEEPVQPKREIQATYDYKDEQGLLLYQAVRYLPKGFSQRRPDGSGGWVYNLQGIRRVVYRLPELKGRAAIVFVEGEKDVDACWKLGIPATCNPMGAGKWDPAYVEQVKAQGIQRVAILPDNDDVGRSHALIVAKALQVAGVDVRIVALPGVPEHGDLTDYVHAGKTKADLLDLIKATPLFDPAKQVVTPVRADKEFTSAGDQRYVFEYRPKGVTLELDRLRRTSHELWGELIVKLNGHHPDARTYENGILQVGDLNLSSVQARSTRAKLLSDRSVDKETDWHGLLEEFAVRVISVERNGSPDVDLRDVALPGPDRMTDFDGVELPVKHPTVIFGDGGSAKSYFALYWAGRFVEAGINVLYADWEWTKEEHRERLERLFGPQFPSVRHLECFRSIREERERIARVIRIRKIQYLIIDSVALACGGDPSGSEACVTYWQNIRQLGIGSLHIAHVTKGFNGKADDQKPFGSAFWHNMARMTYNVKGEPQQGGGGIDVGIYARKSQWGQRKDHAFRIDFGTHRTTISPIDIRSVAELSEGLPLVDRIVESLREEPKTRQELATTLGLDPASVQRVTYREIRKGRILELPGKKGHQRLSISPSGAYSSDNTKKGESVEF